MPYSLFDPENDVEQDLLDDAIAEMDEVLEDAGKIGMSEDTFRDFYRDWSRRFEMLGAEDTAVREHVWELYDSANGDYEYMNLMELLYG